MTSIIGRLPQARAHSDLDGTMKRIILAAMAMLVVATTLVEAQNAPRRPNWPDVCCGGPCCQKPQRPGR